MKKIVAFLMLSALSACSGGVESDFADLYTGQEGGSWYHFSHSCSAQLCPPN